ncbi:hypothetical protein GF420_14025, partial [candidate division GN15 bacterium]|nr:hypothetical protein [candidate division GN15 bacterium]
MTQTGLSKASSRQIEKSGFFIGVTCPGCGSKLKLGDNLFVLICHYCGSHLKLEMPDVPPAFMVPPKVEFREVRFSIDRYLKENNLPLSGSDMQLQRFYYPYWKVEGVLLKVRNRIEKRTTFSNEYGEGYDTEQQVEVRKTDVTLSPYMTTIAAGPFIEDVPYTIGMRADYVQIVPFARDKMDENYSSLPV